MHNHSRLALLAVLVLVTSSLSALADPAPVLSAANLKTLNQVFANNAMDIDIGSKVAAKLGLADTHYRQLVLRDKATQSIHAYYALPGGEMLFSSFDETAAYTYRVGANLKLIASVAMINMAPADIHDPEPRLKKELVFWANVAVQIDAAVHSTGTNSSNTTHP